MPDLDHPNSYYAATADPSPAHPPLEGSARADVCVVGAGFTGVSAALHLAERGFDVAVLDAARVGWGASGRNGGQIGSGMRIDATALEARLGREWAGALWALAEEGKAILHERIGRHSIECDLREGNIVAATRSRFMPELREEAEFCEKRFGYDGYRMIDAPEMRDLVAAPRYCGGRRDAGGGHLHPLNYVLGTARAAVGAGARFHEQSAVRTIEWGPRSVVRTDRGEITAEHVLLCGNAYLGDVERRIESTVMPIVNHVLVTEPLGDLHRIRALDVAPLQRGGDLPVLEEGDER